VGGASVAIAGSVGVGASLASLVASASVVGCSVGVAVGVSDALVGVEVGSPSFGKLVGVAVDVAVLASEATVAVSVGVSSIVGEGGSSTVLVSPAVGVPSAPLVAAGADVGVASAVVGDGVDVSVTSVVVEIVGVTVG
jgi:hypothetical protein